MLKSRDFIIGLATAGTGLVLLWVIIPWQIKTAAGQIDEISPAIFPQILAWLLIVLGVIHMATHWRRDRSATLDAGPAWRPILRAAGAVAIAALYVYLMPVLGYRLATMLTLAGMVLYLGKGRSWRAALVGVMGALIVAEVFSRGLNVPLPRGVWMD
jgi:putative tricarboxylic transport membrane protein